ncbi:hypothetical protein B0H67DRAFT_594634 [Lasiosphaeris hirsuta]|uniref:Uncharacterized protein n=1 Tax=Lasiosphaeris hirsuta TaxID=260670 RepID=A0AA39ZXW3_9PEZI|nr:hypothetical protein B0H67DRAFT_594634 [Lasiosphaeris hirsuta]
MQLTILPVTLLLATLTSAMPASSTPNPLTLTLDLDLTTAGTASPARAVAAPPTATATATGAAGSTTRTRGWPSAGQASTAGARAPTCNNSVNSCKINGCNGSGGRCNDGKYAGCYCK